MSKHIWIMNFIICLGLSPLSSSYAQEGGGHNGHMSTVEKQQPDPEDIKLPDDFGNKKLPEEVKGLQKYDLGPNVEPSNFEVSAVHDNPWFAFVFVDRLEQRFSQGESKSLWDLNSWIGRDYNKVAFESEGEVEEEATYSAELYYNRTISSFWDLQVGVVYERAEGSNSRYSFATAIQGLLPYLFEADFTLLGSDAGDIRVLAEVEYSVLFTQRLRLQPRFELSGAFKERNEFNQGSGVNKLETGLRLRYQVTREFEPYLGISFEQAFGQTRDILQAKNTEAQGFDSVIGMGLIF